MSADGAEASGEGVRPRVPTGPGTAYDPAPDVITAHLSDGAGRTPAIGDDDGPRAPAAGGGTGAGRPVAGRPVHRGRDV
ncbi:hypothetical protein [Streptomyces sp. NPDC058382]|uniref:hypothetical protein n=1 Tax=unclassified Streptomyces TaxID=2593676 RepID=UPI003643192C